MRERGREEKREREMIVVVTKKQITKIYARRERCLSLAPYLQVLHGPPLNYIASFCKKFTDIEYYAGICCILNSFFLTLGIYNTFFGRERGML